MKSVETSPPNPLRGATIGFADIISGAERGSSRNLYWLVSNIADRARRTGATASGRA